MPLSVQHGAEGILLCPSLRVSVCACVRPGCYLCDIYGMRRWISTKLLSIVHLGITFLLECQQITDFVITQVIRTVLFLEKECLRYDREFLLQLRFSAESKRKPVGLPLMPEIIIDAVTVLFVLEFLSGEKLLDVCCIYRVLPTFTLRFSHHLCR